MPTHSYTRVIIHHRLANLYRKYGLLLALTVAGLFFFNGCSTEKNGWAHRAYHNILSHYNGLYNAREIMLEAEAMMDQSMPDDYRRILPVYKEPDEQQAQTVLPMMDEVIEKCANDITKNSIRKRGKEYTKWIDDLYFLMGKAYYYKRDFARAQQLFSYVAKKYKTQETRFTAMTWLARTYIVQENYTKAEKVLDLLETEAERPEKLNLEIRKLYAYIYQKQNNYKLAIPELTQAAKLAKKKPERLRLTYLLGQLYKEEGEEYQAIKQFEKVLKMHPEYKLEFYSKIQMAMAGGGSEVREMLVKMLKDDKFYEFQDQIYYALAEIEYSRGNLDGTIDNLLKSTQVSMGNNEQKGLSFLRLGQIYFAKPDYPKAQMYYDSCITYLPSDYEDYVTIKQLADNLSDLVEQLTIIQHQDSLQRVAKMPEKERDKLINNIIAKRIEEEERKQMERENATAAAAGAGATAPGMTPGGGPGGRGGAGMSTFGALSNNKWYFYNPTTREAGAAEFKRVWGNRPNEDNWRRSIKTQQFSDINEMYDQQAQAAGNFIITESGDTVRISGDWMEPEYYLKELPLTPEAVEASNKKIQDAYYKLSLIYLEQLNDRLMAIKTLEELNNRFPDNEHKLDSWYRLYLMYADENKPAKSDYYKNKILSEYPTSDYAMLIKDPGYFSRDSEEFKAAKKFYESIYTNYFSKGFYSHTVELCDEGIEKYGLTRLRPKFELLRAIATGHTDGKAALEQELQKVAQKYRDNEYGQKAQQLLDALQMEEKRKQQEQATKQAKQKQEQEAQVLLDSLPYIKDFKSRHNFVVIVSQSGGNAIKVKNAISDFNRKNYRMEGLKVTAVIYKGGKQMVTVKSFNNAKQAMAYYKAFKSSDTYSKYIKKDDPIFVVSYENYALFYKDKDDDNYQKWFEAVYKGL